ncbi:unnamed protein product [Somion occarium]|uniref:Haloacid dehalogenase n=1 Tax=Somion occarium TaxID=3059160 RepID=A0ABP1CXV0_9APHY
MSDFTLTKYKALLFDVYCTLVDWETGIYENLKPMLERINSPLKDNKKEALSAYFSVETDLQAKYPTMLYAELISRAHAELSVRLKGEPSHAETVPKTAIAASSAHNVIGLNDLTITAVGTSTFTETELDPHGAEHVAFGKSIASWPVFPDTIAALAYLSTKFKLAVLSNVDKESFSGTRAVLETSDPQHQFKFDAVYTAQDIGSYKPDLANFKYALAKLKEEFGIEKDEVIMVAGSLGHDHLPANALGIASVFIDRHAISLNIGVDAKYDAKYETLGAFAEAVKAAAENQ